jgi:hypothetical protein
MNENRIELMGKLLPIGSLFIILCSSIKLVIYYQFFNISIVEYLGIQEYITSFIDDLLYYLMIFGSGVLLYIIKFEPESDKSKLELKELRKSIKTMLDEQITNLDNEIKDIEKKIRESNPDYLQGDLLKELEQAKQEKDSILEKDTHIKEIDRKPEGFLVLKKKKRRIIRILLGVSILLIGFSIFIPINNYYRFHSIQICIYGGLILLNTYSSISNFKYSFYSFVISAVFLYVIMSGITSAYKIKDNIDNEIYTIKYQDNLINTNDTLHFIGKSDNYLFLYDIKSKKSTILSTDGIKEINIKKIDK